MYSYIWESILTHGSTISYLSSTLSENNNFCPNLDIQLMSVNRSQLSDRFTARNGYPDTVWGASVPPDWDAKGSNFLLAMISGLVLSELLSVVLVWMPQHYRFVWSATSNLCPSLTLYVKVYLLWKCCCVWVLSLCRVFSFLDSIRHRLLCRCCRLKTNSRCCFFFSFYSKTI